MAQLTLRDALAMPAFRQGGPVVVAGAEHLDRPIRWIHVTELADIAPLLRPGDLVLTTGTGLPSDDDEAGLTEFVRSLADAASAGLVIELARRWRHDLPGALREACDEVGLPLVALTHVTRFAALTQAIGEHVIDRQLADLREAQQVHETFTELSFTRAGPADVLEAVQRLAGGLVVLEGADHRPLDFRGGAGGADQLDNWQARSARVHVAGRTGWDERNGWLVTRLGTRDQAWGRLVITAEVRPSERMIAIAERAAAALALHRLHDRDRGNLIRRTHHELLVGLQSDPHSPDVLRRCEVAGFPVRGRAFVGVALRSRGLHRSGDAVDELVATVLAAAESVRAQALVTESDHDVVALLSLPSSGRVDAVVDRFAQRVGERHDVVVAAGRVAVDRDDVDRSVREAQQVADAIGTAPDVAHAVHRLEDTHLRGLLSLLGDDDRLALYVDRELAPLRDHDDLLDAVRALLEHPTSKTDAAASLHLSRAAFYDRLARAQRLIVADLDDPDTRVSLHVALLADRLRSARPATPSG